MIFPAFAPALTAAILLAASPALAAAPAIKGLDSECLETELDECLVVASGYISIVDGPRVAFQTHAGFDYDYGIAGGVVLFAEKDDRWTLLAADFEGYLYDTPRIVGEGTILLHAAGIMLGRDGLNADLLFIFDGAAQEWHEVDIVSWHETVSNLLPKGTEIREGVDYDFGDWFPYYSARTPLWKPRDEDCCKLREEAIIYFDIENRALVPRELILMDAPSID